MAILVFSRYFSAQYRKDDMASWIASTERMARPFEWPVQLGWHGQSGGQYREGDKASWVAGTDRLTWSVEWPIQRVYISKCISSLSLAALPSRVDYSQRHRSNVHQSKSFTATPVANLTHKILLDIAVGALCFLEMCFKPI